VADEKKGVWATLFGPSKDKPKPWDSSREDPNYHPYRPSYDKPLEEKAGASKLPPSPAPPAGAGILAPPSEPATSVSVGSGAVLSAQAPAPIQIPTQKGQTNYSFSSSVSGAGLSVEQIVARMRQEMKSMFDQMKDA